jgi:cytochrome c oxidase assembly protein subunit 15
LANTLKRYSTITFLLTLLTLTVVMVGAFTRLSDAGLGCPDWPGCYGAMIVQAGTHEADKAWIEMIHRYIAGSLGLFIFALTAIAFTKKTSVLHASRGLLSFMSVLIIFQALLGMWTVTKLLHPTIVMLHLLGGMATLSLIWFLHLRIKYINMPARTHISQGIKIASLMGLIIVIMQIALGGWVSTNYAAFACPDFPTCQAQWWPPLNLEAFNIFIPIDRNFDGGFLNHPERVTIHFVHRLGALITALYLIAMSIYFLRAKVISKKIMFGLLIVLVAQISLGILNILLHVPLWAAVLHNGVAAILLLYMVTIYESLA